MIQIRKLVTSDVFKMSAILKKMGLSFEFEVSAMTDKQIGVKMLKEVFENLHLAECEVNAFLGSLIGMDGKAFSELPIEESMKVIEEFKSLPGIKNFLKQAGR